MKTIEISDELYERLKYLSDEIKTQDPRGTATPYFYQVMEKVYEPCWDGSCDKYVWADSTLERSVVENDEVEMLEFLNENSESFKERLEYWFSEIGEGSTLSECTLSDLEEIFEHLNFYKVPVKEVTKCHNAFLTEKSVKMHIEANKHRYESNVSNYLEYAFRNPDLETIFNFLKEL